MANNAGNTLIKLVVLLAVAGAVFFALDSWRKKTSVPEVAAPEASPSTLSAEEAERIGTEIGTRIGTEVGTQIGREIAAQMLAERQAAMAAQAPKPASPTTTDVVAAVKEDAKQAPMAEQTPAVESEVAEAPEAEQAPAAENEVASSEPTPAPAAAPAPKRKEAQGTIPGTPVAQSSVGRDPWWIQTNTGDPSALVLTYAGNFKSSDGSQTGIALMFSGRFDADTDFSGITVTGGDVSGKWRLGVNPGLIYLPGVASGSYTVSIKAGLTDAEGKTLKKDVSGPVDVQ